MGIRTHWLLAAAAASTSLSSAQTGQFRWVYNCQTVFGNCTSNMQLPASVTAHRVLLPGDFDGDNDVDVLAFGPELQYMRNEMVLGPAGPAYNSFSDATASIGVAVFDVTDGVTADFDGDGDLDVAFCTNPQGGGAVWTLANTTGSDVADFQDGQLLGWNVVGSFGSYTSMATADFDGDGDADIVAGVQQGSPITSGVRLLTNDTSAGDPVSLVETPEGLAGVSINDIAAGDIDGDGNVDIVVVGGTTAQPVREFGVNTGTNDFAFIPLPVSGSGLQRTVEIADLDGDGDLDVIFGEAARTDPATLASVEGDMEIFLNDGAGGLALSQTIPGPFSYTDIAVGDVDNDGLVEIVASTQFERATIGGTNYDIPGRTRLFDRAAAGGLFTDVSAARVDDDTNLPGAASFPSNGESIALANVDLDLDLDLIVGHRDSFLPGVFTNLYSQLEAPRSVTVSQQASGLYQWDIDYVMTHDVGLAPAGGLGLVYISPSPPVHVFPSSPVGTLTTANYVPGAFTAIAGPGPGVLPGAGTYRLSFTDLTASEVTTFTGTTFFATAATDDGTQTDTRVTNVVQTTLN